VNRLEVVLGSLPLLSLFVAKDALASCTCTGEEARALCENTLEIPPICPPNGLPDRPDLDPSDRSTHNPAKWNPTLSRATSP
jgi:hypothetical protein